MMGQAGRLLASIALAGLISGCVTTQQALQDLRPGEAPAIESDEAGLWMTMDRAEAQLRSSGEVVEDKALNKYVGGLACRLSKDHCKTMRVYIVRSPGFNASMAPNGALHVWSGLLLRAQNEAQLAYVLGHEIAHFEKRHTLKRWRDLRSKANGLVVFQFATAMIGLGVVGDLAALSVLGEHFAFNRVQETEADDAGLKMMARAGYDPREAPKIWNRLIKEKEASSEEDGSFFFSTHPGEEARRDSLTKAAAGMAVKKRFIGRKRYHKATRKFRSAWLRDELRKRDYGRTEVLIAQQKVQGRNPGMLWFMEGELNRLRDDEGDGQRAVKAYRRALKHKDAPVETFRSLGLVYWSLEQPKNARAAFKRYVKRHPRAEDRPMVESYIQEIEEQRS